MNRDNRHIRIHSWNISNSHPTRHNFNNMNDPVSRPFVHLVIVTPGGLLGDGDEGLARVASSRWSPPPPRSSRRWDQKPWFINFTRVNRSWERTLSLTVSSQRGFNSCVIFISTSCGSRYWDHRVKSCVWCLCRGRGRIREVIEKKNLWLAFMVKLECIYLALLSMVQIKPYDLWRSNLEQDPSLTKLYFRGLKMQHKLMRIVWVGLWSSSHLWSLSPGFLCQVVRAQRVIIVIFSDMWGMHTHNSHLPQLSNTASSGLTSRGQANDEMKRLKYFIRPMKEWNISDCEIKHESQSMMRVFLRRELY